MKYLTTILVLFLLFGCGQKNKNIVISMENSTELYNTFDKDNYLRPDFNKSAFHTLHSWDFGWAILEPINIAKSRNDDKELSKRFSPGQKALYFFWYLDAEVTNGGFIQYYWNGYREYLPPILDGLKLIGDQELADLISKADHEYLANKEKFDLQHQKDDWTPLYKDLKEFEKLDEHYYKIHDKTMALIEKYARQNPQEFVNLK